MNRRNQNDDYQEHVFDPTSSIKLVDQLFAEDTMEQMMEKDLYIMEFNISCKTHNNTYIPIEVGIVKFSIKDGIKDSYHDFIDPGEVPLGYAANAKDLYLNYHGIPVHGFCNVNYDTFCENSIKASRSDDLENYHNSLKDAIKRIDGFVKPDIVYKEAEAGKPRLGVRPVFSYPVNYDGVAQTDGCLRRLASETKDLSFYESFQVMDIVQMLKFACHLKSEKADRPYAVFNNAFSIKILDPPSKKCCDYHYNIDNYRCALGRAFAATYCFLDHVCPHYPIKVTPEHLPPPLPPAVFDREWEAQVSRIFC